MATPHRLTLGALCLALACALAPQRADAQVDGIALARHDLGLSFTISGKVAERLVEPGDRVEAGQPLIRLDDAEAASQLALLQLRAESDIEVRAADAAWRMAINDEQRVQEAFSKSAAAQFEVERAALETQRALLSLELAKQRRAEAGHSLRQAQALLERYTLLAPIAGVVEETMVDAGESVEALRPALRLVVTDPLRIEAAAPTEQTVGLSVGDAAWVRFRLPGHDAPVEGVIVHLAQVADAASATRLVRIDVPNPHKIPAGFAVNVHFERPADATASIAD